MIDNEQQYEATKEQLQKFRDALEIVKTDKMSVHPILRAANIEALKSYIEELEFHIKVYEMPRT